MKSNLVEMSYAKRPKSLNTSLMLFLISCGVFLLNFLLLLGLLPIVPIGIQNYAISTAIFLIPGALLAFAIYKGRGSFVFPFCLVLLALMSVLLFVGLSAKPDSSVMFILNSVAGLLLAVSIIYLFMRSNSIWFYQVKMARKGIDKFSHALEDDQQRAWKIKNALSQRPRLIKYATYISIIAIPCRMISYFMIPSIHNLILSNYTGTTESLIVSYGIFIFSTILLDQWFIRSMYMGFSAITNFYNWSLFSSVVNVIVFSLSNHLAHSSILLMAFLQVPSIAVLILLKKKPIMDWFSDCRIARA